MEQTIIRGRWRESLSDLNKMIIVYSPTTLKKLGLYEKLNKVTYISSHVAFDDLENSIPSGQSVIFVDYKSYLGLGLMSSGILCSSRTSSKVFNKSNIVANTWYHFVIICPNGPTNAERKLYINGQEQTALTGTSNWTFSIDELQVGKRSSTNDGFKGKISDFRVYCTALSAEDIKELYDTAAQIDKDGNVYAYEFKEA